MGEARRKREAVLNGLCPCGSGKVARECCFTGKDWHKVASSVGLRVLPPGTVAEKCYMKELGSCRGPISGEHLISESVIRVLMADGDFSISGVPWLKACESKILSPNSLRANCLCVQHNSALSPLDDAAKYFFTSLKAFLETDTGFEHALISGHDLERWLLKTVKAAAVSKNLAIGGKSLSGALKCDDALLDMLDDPRHWPEGAGLYCVMNTGDATVNNSRFRFQPLVSDEGVVEALGIEILGLGFVLLLGPLDRAKYPFMREANYRPARIVIAYPSSTKWLTLSWEDGKAHQDVNMRFMTKAPDIS